MALLAMPGPLPLEGKVLLTHDRVVLWKNVCLIGNGLRECLIEMSRTKHKFYIVALDLHQNKYHVLELWLAQANKLIKACDEDFEKLMTYLEFRYGVM